MHPVISETATGHYHPGARDRRGEEKAAGHWHTNLKLPFRLAAELRLLTDLPCCFSLSKLIQRLLIIKRYLLL